MPELTLTREMVIGVFQKLQSQYSPNDGGYYVPQEYVRVIDWRVNHDELRGVYRRLGFPFGRNQGAFKRWALLRGRNYHAQRPFDA